MNTNYETLKVRLVEIYNTLLTEYENDIESGIDDGTYEEQENISTRELIKEAKEIIEKFSRYQPAIYIYIEGYNIQGISGTEKISVNKFEMEDFKKVPEEQEMTPKEWDQLIAEKTNTKEIKPIF